MLGIVRDHVSLAWWGVEVVSPSHKNVGSWLCQHGDNSSRRRRRSIVCRASHPYYTQIVKKMPKMIAAKRPPPILYTGHHFIFYSHFVLFHISCSSLIKVSFKKECRVRLVSLIEVCGNTPALHVPLCVTIMGLWHGYDTLWRGYDTLWQLDPNKTKEGRRRQHV